MIYQGSKRRFINDIKPFIQDALEKRNASAYIEPFVGGANAICEIEWHTRYGFDSACHLIALLQQMQKPEGVPFIKPEREDYHWLLEMNRVYFMEFEEVPKWLYGYYFTCCSFSGTYRGGYGQASSDPSAIKCAWNNINEQRLKKGFSDIIFEWADYKLIRPYNSVVYLDPPYDKTRKYRTMRFDYNTFMQWVDEIALYNDVFLSEYKNPDPNKWEEVWSSGIFKGGLNGKSKNQERCEYLFKYKKKQNQTEEHTAENIKQEDGYDEYVKFIKSLGNN